MFKSLLIAVDLAHGARGKELLGKAAGLMDEGGSLHVVYVMDNPPGYVMVELPEGLMESKRKEAEDDLRAMVKAAGLKGKTEVRLGNPANGILAAAEENNTDVILIASHKPGLEDYFLGSTAGRVVRHAQCSVLVLR